MEDFEHAHADFCVDALEEALRRFGRPEIFNTDQGSEFTSTDFTGVLKAHGIRISMDGKGRCMDNISSSGCGEVKYEDIYLHAYASVPEAKAGMALAALTTRNAFIRRTATGRPGRSTKSNARDIGTTAAPNSAPPLPEQDRETGKCSPSPPCPPASATTRIWKLKR